MTVIWCVSVLTARPFAGGGQRARGQDAGEVALKFLAGVDRTAGIDLALRQGCCFSDIGGTDCLAGERDRQLDFGQHLIRPARDNPSFAKELKIPDFHDCSKTLWPPPKTPLALAVAVSMTAPRDPRFSPDWAAAREQDIGRRKAVEERRQAEEKERQVASRRAYEAGLRR
jgi:hypothetical protein